MDADTCVLLVKSEVCEKRQQTLKACVTKIVITTRSNTNTKGFCENISEEKKEAELIDWPKTFRNWDWNPAASFFHVHLVFEYKPAPLRFRVARKLPMRKEQGENG